MLKYSWERESQSSWFFFFFFRKNLEAVIGRQKRIFLINLGLIGNFASGLGHLHTPLTHLQFNLHKRHTHKRPFTIAFFFFFLRRPFTFAKYISHCSITQPPKMLAHHHLMLIFTIQQTQQVMGPGCMFLEGTNEMGLSQPNCVKNSIKLEHPNFL